MKKAFVVLLIVGALGVFAWAGYEGFIKAPPGDRPITVTWRAVGRIGDEVKPYCVKHDYPLETVTLTCPEVPHPLVWEIQTCPVCGGMGYAEPLGGGEPVLDPVCDGDGRVGELEFGHYQQLLAGAEQR